MKQLLGIPPNCAFRIQGTLNRPKESRMWGGGGSLFEAPLLALFSTVALARRSLSAMAKVSKRTGVQ